MIARLLALLVFLVSSAALAAEATLPPAASHKVDFAKEIKPLFEASCVQCHAKGKDKGGLSLETREAFLKGGDDGAVVVVGKSAQSSVVKMVAAVDPDSVMPKKGTKWTPEQVGLLRAWIDQGMEWDPRITFAKPEPLNLKPREVGLPAGVEPHPVDRLMDAYFKMNGIQPPPVVGDRVFCRRAYLDVIGLLPTSAQLDEFLADNAPDKRAKLVRTLLDDKRGYADNWLTFWNDLLRNDYRGTGFIDGGRRQISGWLYSALLENKPYDQFVAELVNPNKESEGFSRGIIWRGSVNASQLPPMQAAQNVSQVFLGINLKCASCHDSFVSDWTLADAYGLAAVYSDDTLELIHCDKPTGKNAAPAFLYPQVGTIGPALTRPQRLAKLAALITSKQDGRLSRTIVNRLWARLLGRGLVEPLDDMEKPAWNSDLLDWLADDLVAHQYDLKHTIEVILTSRAYQMPALDAAAADAKQSYAFHGPILRRLTAEQFSDAITSLTGDWARFPSTIDFDFSAANLAGRIQTPAWVWTDEPGNLGTARLHEQAKKKAEIAAKRKEEESKDAERDVAYIPKPSTDASKTATPAKAAEPSHADLSSDDKDADHDKDKDKDKDKADALDPFARHKVVFRRHLSLTRIPDEAYAAISASQGYAVYVNGKPARPVLSDSERNGRTAMLDLKKLLVKGDNVIVLDVSSHTEKKLNDTERLLFPASRNHINKVSGVGFYLRTKDRDGSFAELVSDASWRVRRAPDGKWKEAKYDDADWSSAAPLPEGVAPVDEGPSLLPITRKDFANEAIELAAPFRAAITTAVQTGGIRAPLLAADTLMTALDRPNREVVMTSRNTAATTLQALELTNGSTLDSKLKRAAQKLAPDAAKDPTRFIEQTYERLLGRPPTDQETKLASELLGSPAKPAGVADFLWAVTQLPEFQFVN